MAKDKKKKKKEKKGGGSVANASKGLKTITQNPLVADVVAAALVATASALKDSNKARRLAEQAGDELEALSKKGAQRGNAMWKLALDIGRQALDTFSNEGMAVAKAATGKTKPKRSANKLAKSKAAAPKKSPPAKKSSRIGRKAK